MGKLILCNGTQGQRPYCFKITNINVFSIEELCYYIYHHVTELSQELREEELVLWIEEELGLVDTAKKLRHLILTGAGLKDIVVSILLSCDYYGEEQIKELLEVVDEFIHLPPGIGSVKRADNFLKYKQYAKALWEFLSILENRTAFDTFEDAMKGKVLHNMGVALLHCKGPIAALQKFKEAYDHYKNKESHKAYFFLLLMMKKEDTLVSEVKNYGIEEKDLDLLKEEFAKGMSSQKESKLIDCVKELEEAKESGKMTKFYQLAYTILEELKQNYRQENL
ncbi:MAG: hypothetical protein ACK5JH_01475 [Anaerocolumna sp.]